MSEATTPTSCARRWSRTAVPIAVIVVILAWTLHGRPTDLLARADVGTIVRVSVRTLQPLSDGTHRQLTSTDPGFCDLLEWELRSRPVPTTPNLSLLTHALVAEDARGARYEVGFSTLDLGRRSGSTPACLVKLVNEAEASRYAGWESLGR